jgi:hypothetical protein
MPNTNKDRIEKNLGNQLQIKSISSSPNILASNLRLLNQPNSSGQMIINKKRRIEIVDTGEKTIEVLSKALDLHDNNEKRFFNLENDLKHTKDELKQTKDELKQLKDELKQTKDELKNVQTQLNELINESNANKQLIKFGDYIMKFNNLFFNHSDEDKISFLEALGREKRLVARELNVEDFDDDDIDHQSKVAEKTSHRNIIQFYLNNGLSREDYFNLSKLRIDRNVNSNPLPKNQEAFILYMRSDIQSLTDNCICSNLSIYKSTLEHLMNGFVNFYNRRR